MDAGPQFSEKIVAKKRRSNCGELGELWFWSEKGFKNRYGAIFERNIRFEIAPIRSKTIKLELLNPKAVELRLAERALLRQINSVSFHRRSNEKTKI